MYGGAIYYDFSVPIFEGDLIFKKNSAGKRTNHIGSYGTRIVIYDTEKPINITYVPGTTTINSNENNPNEKIIFEDFESG